VKMFRRTDGDDAVDHALRQAASNLASAALLRVQEPATKRVRVEDYITVVASMAGEAALVASGVIEIEASEFTPGSGLFGDQINWVLSGDTTDLSSAPADSVIGLLVRELVPDTVPLNAFGSLVDLYEHVAAGIGSTAWGAVALSVPSDNLPTVLPLQVAFELRPAVDAAFAQLGLPQSRRHVPCTLALADALKQVRQAMDPSTALRLALEIVFGMAKMAPMSRRAFAAASSESSPTSHPNDKPYRSVQ
jgi:hypothetical protein